MAVILSELAEKCRRNKDDNSKGKHEFWVGTDNKNVDFQLGSQSKKGGTTLQGVKYLNQKWRSGPRGHPSPDKNNKFYFNEDTSTPLMYPEDPPYKSWTHHSGQWTDHPGFPGMNKKAQAY